MGLSFSLSSFSSISAALGTLRLQLSGYQQPYSHAYFIQHTKEQSRITRHLSRFASFLPALQFPLLDTGNFTSYANSRTFTEGRG